MSFPVVTLEAIPTHGLSVEVRSWALDACGEGLGGSARSVDGQLEVTRVGPDIRIEGEIRGAALVACDRCGELLDLEVAADVSCLYLAPRPADQEEPETDTDELGEYDGVSMDLAHVVRECLALERPIRMYCADLVPGLVTGLVDPSARDDVDIACLARFTARAGKTPAEIDPRLAALKGFKPPR